MLLLNEKCILSTLENIIQIIDIFIRLNYSEAYFVIPEIRNRTK